MEILEDSKKIHLLSIVLLSFKRNVTTKNIVFVAMLIVGSLCFAMSAANTTSYLKMTGMNVAIATMTGIALVVFSSTCMTSASLFLQKSGFVKIFAAPFVLIGVCVVVFSIFSTLSLNYARFLSSDAVAAEIKAKTERAKAELLAERTSATDWTKEKIDELMEISKETGESWANTMKQIAAISQTLADSEASQNANIGVGIEILPASFFSFMLNIAKVEPKYAFDFFMLATPAIFYDLIAPLAVTVVLLLIKGNGENVQKPCLATADENCEAPAVEESASLGADAAKAEIGKESVEPPPAAETEEEKKRRISEARRNAARKSAAARKLKKET